MLLSRYFSSSPLGTPTKRSPRIGKTHRKRKREEVATTSDVGQLQREFMLQQILVRSEALPFVLKSTLPESNVAGVMVETFEVGTFKVCFMHCRDVQREVVRSFR